MSKILVRQIPREELKEYKDYINFLFKNEDGVYNICDNEEDIIKSNQWFNNRPVEAYVYTRNAQDGKKFLAQCSNSELNNKIFTYVGPDKIGVGLIVIKDENNKSIISTKLLIEETIWIERPATMEEKQEIVNGKIPQYYV